MPKPSDDKPTEVNVRVEWDLEYRTCTARGFDANGHPVTLSFTLEPVTDLMAKLRMEQAAIAAFESLRSL